MRIISIIAAVSKNNVIGKDNGIPWKIHSDMQFFKRMTTGCTVIMGRKTFESMGSKPLPNRKNIVVTSDAMNITLSGKYPDVFFASSLQAALSMVAAYYAGVFIIGGEQIYKEALTLPCVDYLLLSRIDCEVEGDTFFPDVSQDRWAFIGSVDQPKTQRDDYLWSVDLYRNNMTAEELLDKIKHG